METKTHSARIERVKFRLEGESCASCASPLRRSLERIRGIEWTDYNPVLDLLMIDYDPNLIGSAEIMRAVEKAGFKPIPSPY